MKQIITGIFFFICTGVIANDSLLISRLLQRIDDLQPKTDGVFPRGCIPAYRMYALNKERYKADVTAFFSAVTSVGLLDIMNDLSPSQKQQAKAIIDCSKSVYPKFRNKIIERNTYNWWPTDTPQIFPNSGFLNLFNKSQAAPDDLDDTVLTLVAQSASDSVAKQVHTLMQLYINNGKKKFHSIFKEYKNIEAYETWFGKKMPVEFDIGAFANILYFVQKYHLTWSKTDSVTLYLMKRMLEEKKHITEPKYISPYYAKTSVILYHVSRLMALKPIPELEKLKPQLIAEAIQSLLNADNFMDQVLLSTSLLRWGVSPPDLAPRNINSIEDFVEEEGTPFVTATMATLLPNPLNRWVGATGVAQFYYYCPAYNNLLLIENLIWRHRRGLS